ncbi:MAG: GDP-mannose 4,6-dehydratase, partial [Hyphomicrobiales bacterium]|nr:GDP-mannose 4,6-dehydratase [Hyphomicrobiales bacterium]
EKLGWRHETKLDDLVGEMVREDLKIMARAVPQISIAKSFVHA